MAHGTPDWGITAGRRTTHQLTDLGELAARLGSPIRHDRRGDVVWWDDFECATPRYDLETSGNGAGAAATRSTARAASGETSWLLTGGSDALQKVGFISSVPPIVLSGVGMEISLNLPGDIDYFELQIRRFDGALLHEFDLRWTDGTDKLSRRGPAGTYEDVASDIDLPANLPTWNVLKLVADLDGDAYVRAIVNSDEYDLRTLSPYTEADSRAPRVDFKVYLGSRSGNNDQCYIDDLIVTQNEPF